MTILGRRICIDPGHYGIDENGDIDPGAVSPNGLQEAPVCLAVSNMVREILVAKGAEVLLTHDGPDADVNYLTPRAMMANNFGADVLLSIHANSFGSAQPKGYEVWTTVGQNNSDVLAEHIFNALGGTGILASRSDLSDGDSDKESNFTVIYRSAMPSCLIEMGFLSNPEDEQVLGSYEGQMLIAQSIVTGLEQYFAEVE